MRMLFSTLLCLSILFAQGPAAPQPLLAASDHTYALAGKATATPQPAPVVGMDVAQWLDEVRSGEPALEEDFNRDRGDWPTGTDDSADRFFAQRAYHVAVPDAGAIGTALAGIDVADFLAEVEVAQIQAESVQGGFAALLFRYTDDDNFYALAVNAEGQIALAKSMQGEGSPLIDWLDAPALAGGAPSGDVLGVLAYGPHIYVMVNDVLLGEAEDATFAHGDVGFLVATDSDVGSEAAFDNLITWDLAGSEDPLAPLEAASVPTVEPTPEPAAFDPATLDIIRAQAPILSENFTRDRGVWDLEDSATAERSLVKRAYHLSVLLPNKVSWTSAQTNVSDFLVELDTTHFAGPTTGDYGVLFRMQDSANFYRYAITAEGAYALDKLVDNNWTTIVSGASPLLEQGEGAANHLGLLAQGALLTLLANDSVLATITDDTFAAGDIALVAGSYDDAGGEIAFDNVEIWDLEGLAGLPALGPAPTLAPAETATPAPTATLAPTATPAPTATLAPTATSKPFSLDDVKISAVIFEMCFDVLGLPRLEQRTATVEGQDAPVTGLVVVVSVVKMEADMLNLCTDVEFVAHFYDAHGDEVADSAPVYFEPEGLSAGESGDAYFFLPLETDRIKTISIM